MALVVKDRVKETTTTTGTGSVTLAGAVSGFQSFSSALSNGDTTYYSITDDNTGDFEVGLGTYNSGVLSRDTILESTNAGSAVNFGSGSKQVFITYPAEKAVYADASDNISVPGLVDGRDIATDGTKLDGIEAGADVTDATNVAAAGAAMTANNLSDLADAATSRTNLGLGTGDSPTFTGVTTTGTVAAADLTVNGNAYPSAGALSNRNRIINSAMQVAQRGTNFAGGTANADDAYTLDRWYILSEGSDSVDVDQIADSPDTGGKCIRLDVETTGEKFGIAQIVEAVNCTGLIGNTVTLSFAAKVSDARIDTIKAGIVAWSGTADTVTSDIVSSWGADGTTPTLIANATFENTPADLGVTTSWATYTVTANVDTASTANLIVFIWSDDATNPLAGDFLYITNVQLELGDTATSFEHRSYTQELALCQRYFLMWRPEGTGLTNFPGVGFGYASGATTHIIGIKTPVTLRATPTVSFAGSLTLTTGSNSAGSLSSVPNVYQPGPDGFWTGCVNTGGTATNGQGSLLYLQNSTANSFSASAEL